MIQYRYVFNDAMVGPWSDVPEINPQTLKGLYAFLEVCPGWDSNSLIGCRSRDARVIDYGNRIQFMFDGVVSDEDLSWLEEEKMKAKSKIFFISGHLDITAEEFKDHYQLRIEKALYKGCFFTVGDARGTDTFAQKLLRDYPNVVVYHMFDHPRHNIGSHSTAGGFKSDEERDAAMTLASTHDIAWVRPGREKSGTAKNIKRRAQ